MLDTREYSALTVAIAEIKYAIDQWQSRHYYLLKGMRGFDNLNPVTVIRRALDRCPDAFPFPTTTELQFIPDLQLKENLRLSASMRWRNWARGSGRTK